MSRTSSQTNSRIFALPIVIAFATLAGLVLGLTGEGLRDFAAWLLVGLAPLVILAALLRRNTTPSKS